MLNCEYLASYGADLIANGFRIIPILPGTKRPVEQNWTSVEATPDLLQSWLDDGKGPWGVGVLGVATPGIDIDTTDTHVLQKIEAWCSDNIGPSLKRIGRAPRALLLFRTDKAFSRFKSRSFKSPDGETHQVEIIAAGGQFVAYATHPGTGRPYEWPNGGPVDYPADLLPTIDEAKARELVAFFESIVPADWTPVQRADTDRGCREGNPNKTAPQRVLESALTSLPNSDLHYDDWIRVAHAVRAATTDYPEDGRLLFHQWSEKSNKYHFEETERAWDSITGVKSIGAGTLFHLAEQQGWTRPVADAAEEFGAVDIELRPDKKAQPRFRFDTYDEMQNEADPEWLVADVLPAHESSLMFGESNTFKSFLALDMALSVVSGKDWHGHDVKPGRALYIATEGAQGIGKTRAPGWFDYYDVPIELRRNFFRYKAEILLDDKQAAVDLAKSIVAAGGMDLVVIDIFGGTMANSETEDTTARPWIQNLNGLMRATGAATLTVAHTGWHDKTRARMHSHTWGSFWTRMGVTGDAKALTSHLVINRHKDADSRGEWGFRMTPTGGSLVPVLDETVGADSSRMWPAAQKIAYAALQSAIEEHGAVQFGNHWPICKVVNQENWREECERQNLTSSENKETKARMFRKARDALLKRGAVGMYDGFAWDKFDE